MGSLQLLSCGSNAKGQLGHANQDDASRFSPCLFHSPASQPSTRFPPDIQQVVKVASGANHTILLLRKAPDASDLGGLPSHEIYGCGDGSRGQLGSMYITQSQTPILTFQRISLDGHANGYDPIDVVTCWETTIVVLRPTGQISGGTPSSDLVISMGANDFGDLGVDSTRVQPPNGKTKQQGSSTKHSIFTLSFNHLLPKEFGSYRVASIASGTHHTLAVLEEIMTGQQIVVGWGACRHGQLGLSQSSSRPSTSTKAVKQPAFTSLPILVRLQQSHHSHTPVKSLSAGHHHSVILLKDGSIVALGSNKKNQTSGVHSLRNVLDAHCSWNGTYAVISDGVVPSCHLQATGSGEKGQLGKKIEGDPMPCKVVLPSSHCTHLQKVACGSEHVLAILQNTPNSGNLSPSISAMPRGASTKIVEGPRQDAEIWGWGWNEHGNLGTGNQEDAVNPTCIWPPSTQAPSTNIRPDFNRRTQSSLEVTLQNATERSAEPTHWSPKDIWAGCGTSWMLVEELVIASSCN